MRAKHSILILGGHGKVALKLTPLLTSNNHTVHSVIRNPDQIRDIKDLGAHPILQDLSLATVKTFTKIINDTKATILIWCASNPSDPESIDHEAAVRCMDAAAATSAKRYITISALDVRDREKRTPPWYNDEDKARSAQLWKFIGKAMTAKLAADRELVSGNKERKLEWNIIRPAGLLDEDGKGKIIAGRQHFGKGISRKDVARVLQFCVDDEDIAGLAFDVLGGETKIDEALEEVAEKRVDCFKGFF